MTEYNKKAVLGFANNEAELRKLIERIKADIKETKDKDKEKRLKDFLPFVERLKIREDNKAEEEGFKGLRIDENGIKPFGKIK